MIVISEDAMQKIPETCGECKLHDVLNHEHCLCMLNYAPVVLQERSSNCPLCEVADKQIMQTNIFDTEEIYHNCTVQVLRNSITGEVSVGWIPGEENMQ